MGNIFPSFNTSADTRSANRRNPEWQVCIAQANIIVQDMSVTVTITSSVSSTPALEDPEPDKYDGVPSDTHSI